MRLRGEESTWSDVENKLKVKRSTMQGWSVATKVVITEELIQGLNRIGYDIQLVKLTDEKGKPSARSYSIQEVAKLAEEEGITYGEYVLKHLRK